jgi:hypothetical protein
MKLFEMCVQAWQEAGLDLKLRLYACTSTTANSGIIQVVHFGVIRMTMLIFMVMAVLI